VLADLIRGGLEGAPLPDPAEGLEPRS
jgi:hypothetical protein